MIPVWCSVVTNVKLGFEYARVIEKYISRETLEEKLAKFCVVYILK